MRDLVPFIKVLLVSVRLGEENISKKCPTWPLHELEVSVSHKNSLGEISVQDIGQPLRHRARLGGENVPVNAHSVPERSRTSQPRGSLDRTHKWEPRETESSRVCDETT